MPFLIVYLLDKGLSFFEIGIMVSGYAVGAFLFEIPTGAFADGYSRKKSVLLGLFSSSIIIFLFPFANSMLLFFILWTLLGISFTFISGAEDAWVLGNLNFKRQKKLKHEYFVKVGSIMGLGMVIGPLIGVFIVKHFSMDWLWYIFSAGTFLSALLFLSINEYYRPKKTSIRKALKNNWSLTKEGFSVIKTRKNLLFLLLGGAFLSFVDLGYEAWQPFLVELTLPVHALGYVFSGLGLIMVFVPFISNYLKHYPIKKVLIISEIIAALFLATIFFILPPHFFLAIFVLLITGFFDKLQHPLIEVYMHSHIPDKVRATTVSINSAFRVILAASVSVIGGLLLNYFPMRYVISFGAVFVIGAVYFYSKLKN